MMQMMTILIAFFDLGIDRISKASMHTDKDNYDRSVKDKATWSESVACKCGKSPCNNFVTPTICDSRDCMCI